MVMSNSFFDIIKFLERVAPEVSGRGEDSGTPPPEISEDVLQAFAKGELSDAEIKEIAPLLLSNMTARKRLAEIIRGMENTHG